MNSYKTKYCKGSKFIIEIAEVHTHYDDCNKPFNLYRIKGFDSLVMTDKALDKLVMDEVGAEANRRCENCTQFEAIFDKHSGDKLYYICKKYKTTVKSEECCEFFKLAKRCLK